MPCLANLWEYKFFIFYGGLAVFALLGILIALAPGVKRRWLKNALAIVGALVAGPAVFVFVVAAGLSILVWLSNPGPQYRSVESPDGAHTATVKYQAGFLGRDASYVWITKKGRCKHYRAFTYYGPSWPDETKMIWRDSTHLRIQYALDLNRRQKCDSHAADVEIICEPFIRN